MSSEEIHRHRDLTYGPVSAYRTAIIRSTGEKLATDGPITVSARGSQDTWSRDTLFPRVQRLNAHARARGRTTSNERRARDFGSNFTTVKKSYDDDGDLYRIINLPNVDWVSNRYSYSGPILGRNPGGLAYPNYSEIALRDEMLKKGSTAIANTIPTNPAVDVGNLIGESMQRLPSLPGAALLGRPGNVSKKFADEYLNVEFGLKPLLSDIDGIASTVKNTNRILEQLERDSGRLIRRRYQFPTEITTELLESGQRESSYPQLATRQYDGAGLYTVTRRTEKRIWFSGAYTYHYSQGSDLWSKLKRAEAAGNRLFGLRLSPSLAWELAPWSWAADWVTNAGDVLRNISAFSRDGLVLKWGYIMCDLRITDEYVQRINLRNYGYVRSHQRFTTHVKKRLKATPYGFGLDPDWLDLSPRQLAILGALGISRGR